MGNPGETSATTTIAAYRVTVATLKRKQRELSAQLNNEVTMPELLERIVAEWQTFKDERRHA